MHRLASLSWAQLAGFTVAWAVLLVGLAAGRVLWAWGGRLQPDEVHFLRLRWTGGRSGALALAAVLAAPLLAGLAARGWQALRSE